jgi:hypothetical protein
MTHELCTPGKLWPYCSILVYFAFFFRHVKHPEEPVRGKTRTHAEEIRRRLCAAVAEYDLLRAHTDAEILAFLKQVRAVRGRFAVHSDQPAAEGPSDASEGTNEERSDAGFSTMIADAFDESAPQEVTLSDVPPTSLV